MKAKTCCCFLLLINYILCNKVVLEYKIIYFYLSLVLALNDRFEVSSEQWHS